MKVFLKYFQQNFQLRYPKNQLDRLLSSTPWWREYTHSCDDESSLPVAGQQRTRRNCRLSTNSANRKRVHFTWTIPILRSEFRADLRRNRRVPRQGEVALVEGHVLSSKAKPNHCFGILRTLTSQRILTSPNHKRKKSSGKRDRKQKKTAIKF